MFRFVLIASLALSAAACSSNASDTATSSVGASSQSQPAVIKQPKVTKNKAETKKTTAQAQAKTAKGFAKYSKALKKEALARGYDKKLVEQVFASLKFHAKVVVADKGQPEFVETLDTYLPKRVNKQRIEDRKSVV